MDTLASNMAAYNVDNPNHNIPKQNTGYLG